MKVPTIDELKDILDAAAKGDVNVKVRKITVSKDAEEEGGITSEMIQAMVKANNGRFIKEPSHEELVSAMDEIYLFFRDLVQRYGAIFEVDCGPGIISIEATTHHKSVSRDDKMPWIVADNDNA